MWPAPNQQAMSDAKGREAAKAKPADGAKKAEDGQADAGQPPEVAPAPAKPVPGDYSNLSDPKNVGAGKDFTPATKRKILEQNKKQNGGVVKSDKSGTPTVPSVKSTSGVTPPANEAHLDHIFPKSKGGTNSPSNARVLTREENREKSDKVEGQE